MQGKRYKKVFFDLSHGSFQRLKKKKPGDFKRVNNIFNINLTDLYVSVQSQMDYCHSHGDRRRVVAFKEKSVHFFVDIFVGHHTGIFFRHSDQQVQKRMNPFLSHTYYKLYAL